jgi:hypothetical protein
MNSKVLLLLSALILAIFCQGNGNYAGKLYVQEHQYVLMDRNVFRCLFLQIQGKLNNDLNLELPKEESFKEEHLLMHLSSLKKIYMA